MARYIIEQAVSNGRRKYAPVTDPLENLCSYCDNVDCYYTRGGVVTTLLTNQT